MKLYSIMPLNVDHADEICDDVERQYRDGVATEALFCMTLTPEGNPAIDKASILCDNYRVIKDKLARRGLRCGALVQATIGHGYKLTTRIPFQPLIGFSDGQEKYVACPYDESFRDYIRDAMTTIAREKPSTIMVDDDFRLFARRSHRGCGCPLHMAEVSRRAGYPVTREELVAKLEETDGEAQRLLDIFYQTQIDSLLGAARAMREGIDRVDPGLPGAFCLCGDTCEGAADIAEILAGEGNPTVIRINNGRYCAEGARGIIRSISRAATQIAAVRDRADVILAETDTCPQNRYSTSAASLHTHFTFTILEGAAGAKHWITRLSAFEPNSGEAYRKKLAKYRGYYDELSRLVPELHWFGCRMPLPAKGTRPTLPLSKFRYLTDEGAWADCVLERLGLPLYFSTKTGGVAFFDGNRDRAFENSELLEMLSGTVVLAAESAKNLTARGFGQYLGVRVIERAPDAPHASGEIIFATGERSNAQMKLQELCPTSPETEALSLVFTVPDGKTRVPLFPGVTRYRNELGGTVIVFSGSPEAKFNFTEAFSMLNESRKRQLVDILRDSGNLPLYYPDDAEVYIKAATMADGKLFCAFFNIGFDPLEDIPLTVDRPVKYIRRLMPDGSYAELTFTADGDSVTVDTPAYTLDPVILILE